MSALPLEKKPKLMLREPKNKLGFEGSEWIALSELLPLVLRNKVLIISVVVFFTTLAYIISLSITPRYTASTLVEINPRQARIVDFEQVLSGLPANVETIQTEIEIIQSRTLADRVIKELDLVEDPEFNASLRPMGLIQSWRSSLGDWLGGGSDSPLGGENMPSKKQTDGETDGLYREILDALVRFLLPPAVKDDDDSRSMEREHNRIVDAFLKNLDVAPESHSRVVRISFTSTRAQTAAEVANELGDFYIVSQLDAKYEATKRAAEWLNERVAELREELQLKERAIERLRAESGLLEGGRDATLASEQASELNVQYMLEVARLAEARARLRQANDLLSSPGGVESSVEVLESPLIRSLRTEEALLERRIADLAEDFGEKHPTMVSARAELKDLRTKIKVEVDRIIDGLRNQVAVAAARASSLEASLERQKQEIAKLNQSEVDVRGLELDANSTRAILETLLARAKQTASQGSFQQADASIISKAVEPRFPSFPPTLLILGISFLISFIAGVLLALIKDNLDLGVRSGTEVPRLFELPSLGMVPRVSRTSLGRELPHDYILTHPNSAFSEGIRAFHTQIQLNDFGQGAKVILLTSAQPGEGKTTVTVSLARALAKTGQRVLVVDCDMRNPTVNKMLGIKLQPGVMECLRSGTLLEEVIQLDSASGAHILASGGGPQFSPEMFASNPMDNLLQQARRQYDTVLLDSSPVLAVSDSLFLARLADKTVFVVRWAKTRRAAASICLTQLSAAQANVVGVVLTMVNIKSHAGYGYGDSGVYGAAFRKYYAN